MATLADMKSRITGELRRSDLSEQIADAIDTAIAAYQTEHFYFNESRDLTFNTVASQFKYGASDNADLANVLRIDYAFVVVGGSPYRLLWRDIRDVESINLWPLFTGQPLNYTWFAQKFFISPIPSDIWQIRLGAYLIQAAPSDDIEDDNVWMNDAERLIRCRAKAELYAHVIKKSDQAELYAQLAADAKGQLDRRTSGVTSTGYVVPFW